MDQKEYIDLDKVKNRKFSSWLEVDAFLRQLEDQTKQVYTTTKSRSIQSYKNNKLNPDLKFGWSLWTCKFAGEHKSTSSGERTTRSYKVSCGAFIKFTKTKDGQQLEITDCQLEHINHSGSEAYYHFIPEKRLLNKSKKELKEEVQGLLRLGAKKTSIQNKLCSEGRGFVAKKDLHNLASKLSAHDDDELSAAVHLLQNTYNANVSIRTVENQFKGMYFSTTEMRESMALAPEILFTDGTYKLFKRNFTLMLILVEDAEGASRVVCAGILAAEDEDTVRWFFEQFKGENEEACMRVHSIMTDKDLLARGVLRDIFSDRVHLYLCLYHTIRTFDRQVSKKVTNIIGEEKKESMQFLIRMAKSTSEEEYNRIYTKFCNNVPLAVREYFDEHWHSSRHEWTKYSMVDGNLGNFTNNRMESINQKIKRDVKLRSKLCEFIKSFFQWYNCRNSEFEFRGAQRTLRQKVCENENDDVMKSYANLVSEYAYKSIKEQYDLKDMITIRDRNDDEMTGVIRSDGKILTTTTQNCKCSSFTTMLLPCRHVFAIRKAFNLPLYDEKLCGKRWKIASASATGPKSSSQPHTSTATLPTKLKVTQAKMLKPKNVFEKRKHLQPTTNSLLDVVTLSCGSRYDYRADVLETIDKCWREGAEVVVHRVGADEIFKETNAIQGLSKEQLDCSHIPNIVVPSPVIIRGRPSKANATFIKTTKSKR